MPELKSGAILFGLFAMAIAWLFKGPNGQRRLPSWAILAIGVISAYLVPPLFILFKDAVSFVPVLSGLTETAVLLGLWVALLVLFLFEKKGQQRRVPIWLGVAIGLGAAVVVPQLLDKITGSYQMASLQPDVNECTSGMLGQSAPRNATNICNYAITVGLCLPTEKNPEPCGQSFTIAPGETANFEPGEARLSSLPSNKNGLTVVACKPPHRPSRNLTVMGRGYIGVCLPDA